VQIEFDEDVYKLVCVLLGSVLVAHIVCLKIVARASQVRGELKTKARPLVEKQYDLETLDDDDEEAKRHTRVKVDGLLSRSSFIFRVC
jgi:hypothetical protein